MALDGLGSSVGHAHDGLVSDVGSVHDILGIGDGGVPYASVVLQGGLTADTGT